MFIPEFNRGLRTVKIWLPAEGFSAAIVTVRDSLKRNRCEPTRYRYNQTEDTAIVSVAFSDITQAEAFARRFAGQTGIRTPKPFETALA